MIEWCSSKHDNVGVCGTAGNMRVVRSFFEAEYFFNLTWEKTPFHKMATKQTKYQKLSNENKQSFHFIQIC